MDKLIEENLIAVLKREGLEPKAGDLEQFSKIIELVHGKFKAVALREFGCGRTWVRCFARSGRENRIKERSLTSVEMTRLR